MDVAEKLEAFAKITERQAQSRRTEVLKEIDTKVNAAVEESRKTAIRECAEKEKETLLKVQYEFTREISLYEGQLKREVILKREEMKNAVFCLAEQKLKKYILSDKYFEELSLAIKEEMKSNDIIKIEVSERDFQKLAKAKSSFNNKLSVSADNIIGGYKLFLSDGKKIINKTYKHKLKEVEYGFNRREPLF